MQHNWNPWWMHEEFSIDQAVPEWFESFKGPNDIALVKAYDNGQTQKGWGLVGEPGFMERYTKGEFLPRRALHGFEHGRWNFAFIMRSLRLICVDIDGKNDGNKGAKELSPLPVTLAETSKSGTGWHLYYWVHDEWDPIRGFGRLGDRLGLKQGVDIRATGCVYHFPQQRWNDRQIAEMPHHLYDQLLHREEKIIARAEHIADVMATGDPMEVMMMQSEVLDALEKPIPEGRRNNTLFAIGQDMLRTGIDNWEQRLIDRALRAGLEQEEAESIPRNVKRYQATVSP